MNRCHVCGAEAAPSAGYPGYAECFTCGSLSYWSTELQTYGSEYWDAERVEALRREREDAVVRALELVYLCGRPIRTILDFGCGYGSTVATLRRLLDVDNVVGIDPFGEFSEAGHLHKLDAAGAVRQWGPQSFDAIYSIEVFEHLQDPRLVLTDLARLLKPGGALLLNTGTRDYLDTTSSAERDNYLDPTVKGHVTVYSLAGLRALAEHAGLLSRPIGMRAYVLLMDAPGPRSVPCEENLRLLRGGGDWLPCLLREHVRLIDVEAELDRVGAWALSLDAQLRS